FRVVTEQQARDGFTLVELLVSIVVLAVFLFIVSQVMNSATAITRTGNKHIDTDTEARVVFDRMAADLGHMLKRSDIDYWLKQQGARILPLFRFAKPDFIGRLQGEHMVQTLSTRANG